MTMASPGEIVLNEVQASNSTTVMNEECKYRDWLELHNTSSQPLCLGDLFLSDDPADLLKWNFPRTAYIEPNGYLLVWADDINDLYLDYHTNFNLSSTGEFLFLSDSLGNILDSVSFSQQSSDHSLSRCADGSGPFADNLNPTPASANDCSGVYIAESSAVSNYKVYPNPFQGILNISSPEGIEKVRIYDMAGREVSGESTGRAMVYSMDLNTLPAGMYLLYINDSTPLRIVRN
jgi:hypothetical protein